MKKTTIRITGVSLLLFTALALIILRPIDDTPLQQTPHYSQMMASIEMLNTDTPTGERQEFKAGWGKSVLTQTEGQPLAGYGKRRGKSSVGVKDPAWVRAFAFDNGAEKVAWVSLDLLLVAPMIRQSVMQSLQQQHPEWSKVFFSATHTHSSLGGWLPGIVGQAIAGAYDEEVARHIVEVTTATIEQAIANLEPATVGYGRVDGGAFVVNGLADDAGATDPWLRYLLIRKERGPSAVLCVFGAHPTCLRSGNLFISRDYPGVLVDTLEALDAIDFAAFSAGAVGSQKPASGFPSAEAKLQAIGTGLATKVAASLPRTTSRISELNYERIPLLLRSSHLRLTETLRVNPLIFDWAVGKNDVSIDILRLGDTVLIGLPCDFSGELVAELEKYGRAKGKALIVTNFNGGYVGYITPDRYNQLNSYETRDMNWYGADNGTYFQDIVKKILDTI